MENLIEFCVPGSDFGVHSEIPDPPSDQLRRLTAEIQNQDTVHGSSFMKVSSLKGPTE